MSNKNKGKSAKAFLEATEDDSQDSGLPEVEDAEASKASAVAEEKVEVAKVEPGLKSGKFRKFAK